jgi:hypothetical protein
MAEKKSSWLTKLFIFFFLILLIIGLGFGAWYGTKAYFKNKYGGNSTNIYQNGSVVNVNNVIEPPQKSLAYNVRWTLISLAIIFGIVLIIWFYFKYRPAASSHSKEKCMKKAIEELNKQYKYVEPIDEKRHPLYFSTPYYGVYDEKNPGWAFIFYKKGIDNTVHFIHKAMLISCCVNAKSLEIFNEAYNRDENDLCKLLVNQGFGIGWPLNWPGVPQRKATFVDLLGQSKSDVNVNVTPEQLEAEGE